MAIDPRGSDLKRLLAEDDGGPLVMLNLLRFTEGGRETYADYAQLFVERVMERFINREVDVLLSTTIIESGLDIPAANTIIINRADQFGLAQLYQLRGRVGRDQDQAYA